MKFSKEHLKEWILKVYSNLFEDGWHIFKIYTEEEYGYSMVKIRKLYDEYDLTFNEDGYKYKTIGPSMERTRDYLFFTSKGYKIEI